MIHPITINPVLNGFVVKVGCQTVVFNNVSTLMDDLEAYLCNTEATEQRYREKSCNRWMLMQSNPCPVRPPVGSESLSGK